MIDVRTLLIALAFGNLVLGGLLVAYQRGGGMTLTDRLWTGAKLGQGVGFILLGLRDQIPNLLSIPVANAVVLLGFALEFAASWEFLRIDSWRRYLPYLYVIGLGPYLAVYGAGADTSLRVFVITLAIGGLFALTAAGFIARWRTVSTLGRAIAVADAIVAAVAVARAIWALVGADVTMLSNVAPQAMTFVTLYAFTLVNGFGFLLMTKQEADRELTRLATLDPLTEVFNRRSFFAQSESALALARRNRQPFAVLMLDLDHFKAVNDTHGHKAGDEVIRALVRVCQEQLRESDVLGRIGGEEFAVALPSTAREGALRVAERVREATQGTLLRGQTGAEIRFTVSIGVAESGDERAMDPILARADRALYESKRLGRNRVTVAD